VPRGGRDILAARERFDPFARLAAKESTMDFPSIVPVLALITLAAVLIFALRSKKKIDERKADPSVPKSTLAADAPNHSRNPPDV
jgi:hypothetical protein